MGQYDYDLFVIGAGSGGVRAARISATLGAKVGICEDRYLGGTCVNVGCVPKKLLVYASHFAHDFEDSAGYGWRVGERSFHWRDLIANKDKEVERLNGVYDRILQRAGVEIIHGRGTLVDPHTVSIEGRKVTAERILICTGGWPGKPAIPGGDHGITSNEAFYLPDLPRSVVIAGAGYIAVEFACIFRNLGADVHLVHRGDQILRGFDDDVRYFLQQEMSRQGVQFHFERTIERVDQHHDGLCATLNDGTQLETETMLCATGRRPNTAGLGLEAVGVALTEQGAIKVDDDFRTSVPSIFALGDVIDRMQLTPVALAEGMAFARAQFGGEPTSVDYDNVPTAVFSQPNIGTVGLSETNARAKYGRIKVFKTDFRSMKHALTGREERTFMKLIVDEATDRVVGCHMVGHEAGEIVQGLGIALKCGATKAQFDATIGIHPTLAEEFVTMRSPVAS